MLVKVTCPECGTVNIVRDDIYEDECSGCSLIICVQDGEPCDQYDLYNE